MRPLSAVVTFLLLVVVSLPGHTQQSLFIPWTENKTIFVGVRDDASPFSYLASSKSHEQVLNGYGGYMVEICRRILTSMTENIESPFAGYDVKAKRISATGRFDELEGGEIDILCGPNSITLDRISRFHVSMPVFLSGITYVSVTDEKLPRNRNDCIAVVGLLANTTAQGEGLQTIAQRGLLELYDNMLDEFLALPFKQTSENSPLSNVNQFKDYLSSLLGGDSETNSANGTNALPAGKSVFTPTCAGGYKSKPGPIVLYEKHSDGIDDLCQGRILFYVGDSDIIRNRLENNSSCKDAYKLHHETLTHEAYAIFFRRSKDMNIGKDLTKSLLFAEFNNELLRKMQKIEHILDYEFSAEFNEVQPSDELTEFFSAYQFIKDQ